ncbi:class I SAM-dependent methyltransferase [Gemmobacter nanjingensis]|nr:class I SAM-dependent methyltransferase [Gemmobacter nanjingensis]
MDQDLNIPLSSQAVFWRPRHVAGSPLLEDIPYLFWVLETVRPRSVVQVGLGDGLLYLALCQAVERLGTDAVCLGIQEDAAELPEALRHAHDSQYGDFSLILRGDRAGEALQPGEIDMLVVDAGLSAAQAGGVVRDWLPRLSRHGIVLVCNPDGQAVEGALRAALYGDDNLLRIAGPLSPAAGRLDALLWGADQPERLKRLAASNWSTPAHRGARLVFGRLGRALVDAWAVSELRESRRGEPARRGGGMPRAGREDAFEALMQEKARLEAENARLARQCDERIEDIAVLVQTFDRDKSALQAGTRSAEAEVARLREHLAAAERAGEAGRSQAEEVQKRNAMLEAERSALQDELARVVAEGEARLAEMARRHADEIRALHDSTSWRITRPMRSVKQAFSRKG